MGKLTGIMLVFALVTYIGIASGAVSDQASFRKLIQRVIGRFRPWAKKHGGEQFAVALFMDDKHKWNEFKYRPTLEEKKEGKIPDLTGKDLAPSNLVKKHLGNYVGALPTKDEHAEERILHPLLKRLRLAYTKVHKLMPKRLVLYSWIVPCVRKTCSKSCKSGCTDKLIEELEKYVKMGMEVVVAFTSVGGEVKNCKCDVEETRRQFAKSNIELEYVRYDTLEELMKNLLVLEKLIE